MTRRRVAITGLGLVCSQGTSARQAFEAWCAGQSGIGLHPVGEAPHSTTAVMAACTDFDAAPVLGRTRLTTMDRVSQLSAVAGLAAWQDATLDELGDAARQDVCVMWGTGSGGAHTTERSYRDLFVKGRSRISPLSVVLGMNNAPAAHIALLLRLGGACLTYSVACASSAMAIGEAFRRVQTGQAVMAVAGGGEASMPYGLMKAWESLQVTATPGAQPSASCRPFDARRSGLALGEGAAALVLEDLDHALQRGARIYAELAGYGSSCDHTHLTAPDAAGQTRALLQALQDAQVTPADVRYVNAHGTATLEGDPVEIDALKAVLGPHAAQTMISSTKSMHGHLLGAAGAIEALATTLALHHDVAPPTAHLDELDPACAGLDHVSGQARHQAGLRVALSNSFAFGGSNAVLVLKNVQRA